MHFLIEINYEPAAANALSTLVMEAGEKLSTAISGVRSDGYSLQGSWVALESCAAYLVVDSSDGLPVYEICHEVTRCAPGIKARVIPVLPAKMLTKRLG